MPLARIGLLSRSTIDQAMDEIRTAVDNSTQTIISPLTGQLDTANSRLTDLTNTVTGQSNLLNQAQADFLKLKSCQVCFSYASDGDSGQCNSLPSDGTSAGNGVTCAPIEKWTGAYRDDTDSRGGGCRLKWKLDCSEPYGD